MDKITKEKEFSEEYPEELAKQEKKLEELDDFSEEPPSDIVAFNELRSCADLYRMYKKGQLNIRPDFQRDLVWSPAKQTRFIDSLVKQLPIPSMCISLDYKTGKRLMIDGLQRISSIINFLDESNEWKLSKLPDIDTRIANKTTGEIRREYPEIYNRLENLTIPVTVLRSDYSVKNHMNYLFTIFHRLNTGGVKLNNQEIRNSLFQGTFNSLLKELVLYPHYRHLFSLQDGKKYRFRYEEQILRFFSFHDNYENYTGKLSQFLNDYMEGKRDIPSDEIEQKRVLFKTTTDILFRSIEKFPKLSKATTEGIYVGIARNIGEVGKEDANTVKKKIETLRGDVNYSVDVLKEGVAQKDKVKARLKRAIEIFSE